MAVHVIWYVSYHYDMKRCNIGLFVKKLCNMGSVILNITMIYSFTQAICSMCWVFDTKKPGYPHLVVFFENTENRAICHIAIFLCPEYCVYTSPGSHSRFRQAIRNSCALLNTGVWLCPAFAEA